VAPGVPDVMTRIAEHRAADPSGPPTAPPDSAPAVAVSAAIPGSWGYLVRNVGAVAFEGNQSNELVSAAGACTQIGDVRLGRVSLR